jgi:peptidoglycan/LPS O-acetylase OafA/YrhL
VYNKTQNAGLRVAFFDGMRGWAALTVMLAHICRAVNGHEFEPITRTPFRIFFDGRFAVAIFFVLSGVALSLHYMKQRSVACLTKLVIKRLPRLGIPVLFSTVFIHFLIINGFMCNHEAAVIQKPENVWLGAFYSFEPSVKGMIKSIPNVFLIGDASYNSPVWTMRRELIGSYFIVLVMLALHFSKPNKAFIIWLASTVISLVIAPVMSAFSFGLLISYLFINEKDMLLKLKNSKLMQISAIAVMSISYILILVLNNYGFTGFSAAVMSITAFLVVGGLLFINIFISFFSCKISRFLGKISFPLYVVHFPVICSFTSYLMIRHPNYSENSGITILIYVLSSVLSLTIACLFYPVEKLSL